jgi:nucleotide-binding universal stress UspA family protein
MSGTILVGVDESTPSRSALLWSIHRAVALGSSLELLHVVDDEGGAPEGDHRLAGREAAARLLRSELEFARAVAPDLMITTRLADGPAEDALVRRSAGHALMVIGTHKTGFIYGRTFGSRFLGLAARAHCHVAFIPDQAGVARRGVVAAAESTPAGEAVVLFAAAEAHSGGHELTLVGRTREDTAAAATMVRTTHPDLHFRSRTSDLPLAEALIESSANAALLVIGRPRRSTVARAINHDVLVNMGCPVIVLAVG